MRLYALIEAGDPEAIDVYVCRTRKGLSRTASGMNLTGAGPSGSKN